jgi:hypothetical protein
MGLTFCQLPEEGESEGQIKPSVQYLMRSKNV